MSGANIAEIRRLMPMAGGMGKIWLTTMLTHTLDDLDATRARIAALESANAKLRAALEDIADLRTWVTAGSRPEAIADFIMHLARKALNETKRRRRCDHSPR